MGLPTLRMIANRPRPGTISRKSSRRLPAVSAVWADRPVTLPPGRASEATRPVPTGSPAAANTIGMHLLCGEGWHGCHRNNDIDLEPDQLGRVFCDAFIAALCPAILNREVATIDPAEFTQPLHKSGNSFALNRRVGAQEPDGRQLACLLRARRERRGSRRRAAEQRYELAALHSITSSARASRAVSAD